MPPTWSPTDDWTAEDFQRAEAAWPKLLALVKRYYEGGILLAAGSDTPNPWVIPGESLHRELELLVDAGISPGDALQIATRQRRCGCWRKQAPWSRGSGEAGRPRASHSGPAHRCLEHAPDRVGDARRRAVSPTPPATGVRRGMHLTIVAPAASVQVAGWLEEPRVLALTLVLGGLWYALFRAVVDLASPVNPARRYGISVDIC